MDQVLLIDEFLFQFINLKCSSSFLDVVAPFLRNSTNWIPVYTLIAIIMFMKWKWNGIIFILSLGLAIGVSDTMSSKLVKKTVKRPRPCHVFSPPDIDVRVHCGSGYSFTSSHATNHFCVALFLSYCVIGRRKRFLKVLLFTWASSIAFSQVYVGVHYPLDVFFGSLLGLIISFFMYRLYKVVLPSSLQLAKTNYT